MKFYTSSASDASDKYQVCDDNYDAGDDDDDEGCANVTSQWQQVQVLQ